MFRLIKGAMCLLLLLACQTGASIPSGLDLRLLKTLSSNLAENQAISPFVLSSQLSQIWLGVGGDTRKQISNALGLKGSTQMAMAQEFLPAYKAAIEGMSEKTSNVTTVVFNRIYARSGISINPSFSQLLQLMYGSSVREFQSAVQAAVEINTDVCMATRGRIQTLVSVDDLDKLGMVLVSALYFKDRWQQAFRSSVQEFFLTASGNKRVGMMKLQKKLKYRTYGTFDVLELPYSDRKYCMLIMRPLERSMTSVKSLRSKLDKLNINDMLKTLMERDVSVSMPRFKMDVYYSLKSALSSLGIKKLFSSKPDVRGMSGLPERRSDIYHRVYLKVDEEGTEAAGAAATIVTLSAKDHRIVDFKLNRPFFMILYNKKHQINMFSAYVASP